MTEATNAILRWIGVLPAAVAAYAAVLAATVLGQFAVGGVYFWQLLSATCAPIAFVYAGSSTAPTHRLSTAITLAVIHAMVLAALFGFVVHGSSSFSSRSSLWWDSIRAAIGVVMTIGACRVVAQNEGFME